MIGMFNHQPAQYLASMLPLSVSGEPGSLGLGEFGGRILEAESQRLGPEQS